MVTLAKMLPGGGLFAEFEVHSGGCRAGTLTIARGNFYFPTPPGHRPSQSQKLKFHGRRQIFSTCGWKLVTYRQPPSSLPAAGGPGRHGTIFHLSIHLRGSGGRQEGARMVPGKCSLHPPGALPGREMPGEEFFRPGPGTSKPCWARASVAM